MQNDFGEGDEVETHSLRERALNGCRGWVVGIQNDRVVVQLPEPHGQKALRPANLRLVSECEGATSGSNFTTPEAALRPQRSRHPERADGGRRDRDAGLGLSSRCVAATALVAVTCCAALHATRSSAASWNHPRRGPLDVPSPGALTPAPPDGAQKERLTRAAGGGGGMLRETGGKDVPKLVTPRRRFQARPAATPIPIGDSADDARATPEPTKAEVDSHGFSDTRAGPAPGTEDREPAELAIPPVLDQLGELIVRSRFPFVGTAGQAAGRDLREFVCMRFRAAELVNSATAAGNATWQLAAGGKPHSDFLVKCFESMIRISDRAMAAFDQKLLLVPDEDAPAQLRGADERRWLELAMPWIGKHTGADQQGTVCDKVHRSWLLRQAPPGAAVMLESDPTACKQAEAAACRRAAVVLQFGGPPGDFATAGRGLVYPHCGDILARKGRRRRARVVTVPESA
eukprot:TRINITY_DN6200_c0_g1_i1.p1 TRINITY_DN6200_c0_g1~~TRINITY_DN6200_c0_g1_i1.p1  ORF type:complete len:459 (+),score=75.31 TRINITY_DN6200_c0_g1_i1:67-1443(+)